MADDRTTPKFPPMAAGQRYGRLISINRIKTSRRSRWLFRCDCGSKHVADAAHVRNGSIRSCGCLHREGLAIRARIQNRTHGLTKSPEYRTWRGMVNRCRNPRNPDYPYYGGRGIEVCDRWRSFENFLVDMGPRPSLKYSIERREVNGNYEPGNCRWATTAEQSVNRRNTVYVEYNGRRMLLIDACVEAGLDHILVRDRLRHGWSEQRALSEPVRTHS